LIFRLTYLLLILITTNLFSQDYLSFHEKGKWGALDTNGKIVISPKYNKLGSFVNGYVPVLINGKWGVINIDGERTIEATFLDLNLFRCHNKTLINCKTIDGWGVTDSSGNEEIASTYLKLEYYEKYYFGFRDKKWFLGKPKVGEICANGYNRIVNLGGFYKGINTASYDLIDSLGNVLMNTSVNFRKKNDYFIVEKVNKSNSIYNNEGALVLDNIYVKGEINASKELVIRYSDSLLGLYSLRENKLIIQGDYDSFLRKGKYVYCYKNDLTGVLDSLGNILLPVEYNFIGIPSEYSIIEIKKNDLVGLVSIINGEVKVLLEPLYEFIAPYGVASVYSKNGLYGFIDVSGKVVSKCIYDNVQVIEEGYKAYNKDELTVYKFTNNGRYLERHTFNNVIVIKAKMDIDFGKKMLSNVDLLKSYGWYLDSIPRKSDSTKFSKFWGLKDKNDSILIKPKYRKIDLQNDWTLAYVVPRPTKVMPTSFQNYKTVYRHARFDLIKNDNSQKMNTDYLHYVHGITNNFNLSNKNATFDIFDTKGFHIVDSNFNIIVGDIMFSEESNNKTIVRFCKSNALPIYKSKEGVTSQSASGWWGRKGAILRVKNKYKGPKLSYVEFPDSKWGYYRTNGSGVIDPVFDYTYEFENGFGKVYLDGKYGAVSIDSLVVPTQYSDVSYFRGMDDTLIKVKSFPKNHFQIIDSLANEKILNYEIVKFYPKSKISLVRKEKRFGFVDQKNEFIVAPIYKRRPRIMGDYLVVKNKKKGVFDFSGNEVAPFIFSKIKRVEDDCVVFYKGNRVGVFYNGKEIIPPIYEGFDFRKNHIVAHSKYSSKLYNYNNEVISKSKWNFCDVNENKGWIAYSKKGVIEIKSEDNSFKAKFKNGDDFIFLDSILLMKSKVKMYLLDVNGNKLSSSYDRIAHYKDSLVWVFLGHKKGLVSYTGNVILKPEYKNIVEVFEGVFAGVNSKGMQVYDASGELLFTHKATWVYKSDNNVFLAKSKTGYEFLNQEFLNPVGIMYANAKPFIGDYASVSINGRWSVINNYFALLFEPSYAEVTPISENVFKAQDALFEGMWNVKGEEILETKYDKISRVNGRILRVVKDGLVGYVYIDGRWIYNPFKDS